MKTIVFAALSIVAITSTDLQAQGCPLTIDVVPTHPTYDPREPLEVELRLTNSSDTPVGVELSYPLYGPIGAVISFKPGESLKRSANLPAGSGNSIGIGVRIGSGKTLSTKLYLQRFLDGFVSGRYEISWDVSVPCQGTSQVAASAGQLRFDVSEKTRSDLAKSFDEYVQRLLYPQLDDSAPMSRNEAGEAIRMTTSPEILPHLSKIQTSGSYRVALDALTRFHDDPAARKILEASIQSDSSLHVFYALKVLSSWKERLTPGEARTLLEKKNREVRLVILNYLSEVADTSYIPTINQFVSDPDSEVATAARKAATSISTR